MDWYYVVAGQQVGPLSDGAFRAAVVEGRVQAETLVWHEGLAEWQTYGVLAGGAPTEGTGAGYLFCCECGRAFPRDNVVRYEDSWVCLACQPMFLQRVQEGAAPAGAFVYGGFFSRLAAKIIDVVILWVVNAAVGAVVGVVTRATAGDDLGGLLLTAATSLVLGILIGAAYTTFFLGKFGATPGKMALGLKVVRPDGRPISYARACGRHFSEWISSFLLGIGYLMAAFDSEKRSLHDCICDTRVVRR